MYTAKQEGKHLSLIVLAGHRIVIKESKYLQVGEKMAHPGGHVILLVVADVDAEAQEVER